MAAAVTQVASAASAAPSIRVRTYNGAPAGFTMPATRDRPAVVYVSQAGEDGEHFVEVSASDRDHAEHMEQVWRSLERQDVVRADREAERERQRNAAGLIERLIAQQAAGNRELAAAMLGVVPEIVKTVAAEMRAQLAEAPSPRKPVAKEAASA